MQVPVGLLLYSSYYAGMAMPGIAHADPADEVDIGLTGRIEQVDTFRFYNFQADRRRRCLRHMPQKEPPCVQPLIVGICIDSHCKAKVGEIASYRRKKHYAWMKTNSDIRITKNSCHGHDT